MVLIAATVSVVFIRFEAGSSFVASATFTGDFIKPPSMAYRSFLETVRCRPEFRVGATAGDSFFGSSVFSFFGEGISISILSANACEPVTALSSSYSVVASNITVILIGVVCFCSPSRLRRYFRRTMARALYYCCRSHHHHYYYRTIVVLSFVVCILP